MAQASMDYMISEGPGRQDFVRYWRLMAEAVAQVREILLHFGTLEKCTCTIVCPEWSHSNRGDALMTVAPICLRCRTDECKLSAQPRSHKWFFRICILQL
jgi:hypothetical protein